jgi:ornithine cyclodeaminase
MTSPDPSTQATTEPGRIRLRLVSRAAVAKIVSEPLAFAAAKRAFIDTWGGAARNFPVLAATGGEPANAINVKLAYDRASVGFKVGTFWPDNESNGLPNHGATTILLDPGTGFPTALIEASLLNRYRTAAADAVATDALARADAGVLAIVGSGKQAEHEVRGVARIRRLSEIRIGARDPKKAHDLARRLGNLSVPVRCLKVEAAVCGAEIVICATNAVSAVVRREWISPGTHISAMGADRIGKQELATSLVANARLFADDPRQAVAIGECQHAFAKGLITELDVAPIGGVLLGAVPGRKDADEITIFDSSGLAAQDLAIGADVLEQAERLGLVTTVDL